MTLLRDEELLPLLSGSTPIVTGHGYKDDWYAKGSPIQPSSIDMTIGDIFLPGAKLEDGGGEKHPLSRFSLNPGQTAIVTTRETVHLSPDLAAIGFPPSSVSFKGLLMTNPGHLDPGYTGKLRFTVINMGSQQYPLDQGASIVTLLIFKLSSPSKRDWQTRGNADSIIKQENIDLLCDDFMDIRRRAKKIADRAVRRAVTWATVLATVVTLSIPLVAFLLGQYSPEKTSWGHAIESSVNVLKESCSVERSRNRIEALEDSVRTIKAATCKQAPLPPYCESQPPLGPALNRTR